MTAKLKQSHDRRVCSDVLLNREAVSVRTMDRWRHTYGEIRSIDYSVLFTPEEASEFLRISAKTLERWRSNGLGPRFVKIGRRVAYGIAALEEFITQHTYGSSAEFPSE
jgi:predicted DNA-binding transcriptional regulator AlpA